MMSYSSRRNSAIAYAAITDLHQRQCRVFAVIEKYPNVSRNDIARIAKMEPSNVSSRICELCDEGYIRPSGKKVDHRTKRRVTTYVSMENVEATL